MNIPVFEDDNVRRHIEFFPDIDYCYAVKEAAVTYHSDAEGDPWSIFDSNGIHIGTFCTRKSRIFMWPDCQTHGDFRPGNYEDSIKLTRLSTPNENLKNAIRYAWLNWVSKKRSGAKRKLVRFGEKGYFFVPYNKEIKIYGETGSYIVFNPKGIIVGKVTYRLGRLPDAWESEEIYDGHWQLLQEGKKEETLALAKELLEHAEENWL